MKKNSSSRIFSESDFLNLAYLQQNAENIKPMPVRVKRDTLIRVDYQFPQCTFYFTNEPSLSIMEREQSIKDLAVRFLEMMSQTKTLIVFHEKTLFLSEEDIKKSIAI
ncbi:MAG: hypothetical protein ACJATA_001287 [Sphingobacteriales bacterium]